MHRSTRLFASGSAVTFVVVGALFILVGFGGDSWSQKEIRLPNRKNILETRGLFGMSLYDDYGTGVFVRYYEEDINGDRRDPYCGSPQATSVFAQYLPVLLQNPNTGIPTSPLPPSVCCTQNSIYQGDRDSDTNNWCKMRDSMVGLAVTAVVLVCLAALATSGCCCCQRNLIPMIVFAFLGGTFGLAASGVFLVWLRQEQDDIDQRDNGYESDIIGTYGHILFLLGWIFPLIGSFVEVFALCSTDNEPTPPPTTVPTVYGDEATFETHTVDDRRVKFPKVPPAYHMDSSFRSQQQTRNPHYHLSASHEV